MKKQKPTAHADGARHSRRGKEAQPHDAQSPEQKQERKDRVLTEGASSMVRDIGDASAGTGYPMTDGSGSASCGLRWSANYRRDKF